VQQPIAVTHEELDEGRLIAFGQAVPAQPSLLEMRRLHLEGVANEASG
jgi:hypothetical protein